MGKYAVLSAFAFAAIGACAGAYVMQPYTPHMPSWFLLVLCPTAVLEVFIPTADPDGGFRWMVTIVNAIIYGFVGITLANYFRLDEK
jgi:hypothetical protein